DMAFADALGGMNGFIGHGVASTEEGHGAGRRVRKPVGEQIEKLPKFVCPYRTEPRRQIVYFMPCHVGGQKVIKPVSQATPQTGLRARLSSTYHHVMTFFQLRQQAWNEIGRASCRASGRNAC